MSVLNDPIVKAELRKAWLDSEPGTPAAHEEGGFVIVDQGGRFRVERWPSGDAIRIRVPDPAPFLREVDRIVATFHTHPHEGPDYIPGPSIEDIMGVLHFAENSDLAYEGEFVISTQHIFRITTTGIIEECGEADEFFSTQ